MFSVHQKPPSEHLSLGSTSRQVLAKIISLYFNSLNISLYKNCVNIFSLFIWWWYNDTDSLLFFYKTSTLFSQKLKNHILSSFSYFSSFLPSCHHNQDVFVFHVVFTQNRIINHILSRTH